MQRFKRILLVGGDGLATTPKDPEFLDFARANDAELTLAAWCATPTTSILGSLLDRRRRDLETYARQGLDRALTEAADGLRQHGFAVDTVVLEGDPAEAVVGLAETGKFDIVVKAADGAEADSPFTFGALDRALIRHSPVPVLIVKPQPDRVPRVMIALDVANPAHARLNEMLMDLAIGQAELSKGELHVAHAWELVGEAALRSGAFTEIDAAEIDALKGEEREVRHAALQALLQRHADSPVPMVEHLVEGSPPLALGAVAKAVQPHVLVMGVTPRKRFASLVLNDLAQAMLAAVDCSVLLVNSATVAEAEPA